ncbi:MAG: hypothetical protein K2L70_00705 [Clostridia bacterium]|nr:hypothetical protein [Clostridia bacterium]
MSSRIISVSYGHGSSHGKLYDYETDKKYQTGDVVVVPVEHHKSHKMYNTLAVVQLTNDEGTAGGMAKADHITDPKKNINPKNVSQRLTIAQQQGLDVSSPRDVTMRTLPGYKNRASNEKWSGSTSRLISREE